MIVEMRQATAAMLARLEREHAELCRQERADIMDASRNRGTIKESSWQRRLTAERRILAARNLLEALSDP
jgi:hypothetical protein